MITNTQGMPSSMWGNLEEILKKGKKAMTKVSTDKFYLYRF